MLLLLLALACRGSLSPLSNRIQVGQEAYVVFTADGEDGAGDLFASPPTGGTAYQITFTRVDEELPALSRDGTMLAFFRGRAPGDERHRVLVVMNLVNAAERQCDVGETGPGSIAWSSDGGRVYVRLGESLFVSPTPPNALALTPLATDERPAADSQFAVLLGDPPLATAVSCDSGGGICARFGDGRQEPISRAGADPVRWRGDSVTYNDAGKWTVRPLAGGETRRLQWGDPIHRPRDLSFFAGPPRNP
jgi:hypothetical protein